MFDNDFSQHLKEENQSYSWTGLMIWVTHFFFTAWKICSTLKNIGAFPEGTIVRRPHNSQYTELKIDPRSLKQQYVVLQLHYGASAYRETGYKGITFFTSYTLLMRRNHHCSKTIWSINVAFFICSSSFVFI